MRVKVKNWTGTYHERSLEDALRPAPDMYGESMGSVEMADRKAQEACDAVGRTLAMLVDKGIFTLEEAVNCAGISHDVEEVKE